MPVITPKSPEVLQAQAAAFAAEYSGYGDGRDLAQEIGKSTVGMEVSFDTPPSQREFVESSREKEYLEFLRKNDGQKSFLIQERAGMIKRYAEFAPAVDELMAELEEAWLSHPNFLGMGKTCNGFRLEHEGHSYALRLPAEEGVGIDREYVAPSIASKGKARTEQMVALSYENGATISELIPGKGMDEITPEEVAEIPDEHLEGLAETIASVQESGLLIDSKGSNILYDSEEGFGFIDLSCAKYPGGPVMGGNDMASMISLGGDVLIYPMHLAEKEIEETSSGAEANEAIKELYDVFIPILDRYRVICLRKFADHESLPTIEYQMGQRLTRLSEYRNHLIKSIDKEEVTEPEELAAV